MKKETLDSMNILDRASIITKRAEEIITPDMSKLDAFNLASREVLGGVTCKS